MLLLLFLLLLEFVRVETWWSENRDLISQNILKDTIEGNVVPLTLFIMKCAPGIATLHLSLSHLFCLLVEHTSSMHITFLR